ncbi:hypothetical protein KKF91_08480 [Myxococcota bacterium]|nr:hypothetical protein [Myxococcota bacterium]MBU1430575.1 hypothetical protein [Myxococcota bacterium]MBU1900152.1 hypothetical protein [Myxococcota bacterium]
MSDPDDPIYAAVLDALTPLDVSYIEGVGATDQATPLCCPRCGGAARYLGSEVLEGSLEWYHVVHTEVDHHLKCASCAYAWVLFKLL